MDGKYPGAMQAGSNTLTQPKQNESEALLSRLRNLRSNLSDDFQMAKSAADKIVGSVPEPAGVTDNPNPPSGHFLLAADRSITELEQLAQAISNQLSRLHSAF